jgi:Zn-dependent protease with chaperone function
MAMICKILVQLYLHGEFMTLYPRATQTSVKLTLPKRIGNLPFASMVTIGLLFTMVFVLSTGILFILESEQPNIQLVLLKSVGITLLFNTASFFIAPLLMDLCQNWLYKTEWVDLDTIAEFSPESASTIARVCQEHRIKVPRLGIIDDQNPTAFTFGSVRNRARLVVSKGLFTYLDDEEVATVYAHELGHIVHWDFAVMTVASTLSQITYLIYIIARRLPTMGNDTVEKAIGSISFTAYIFYEIGLYMLLSLSRTREYFADYFAAEVTGNPNALSRALVKIAYGIMEEQHKSGTPSQLIQGTRALGIYDPRAAASTGKAYQITDQPEKVGRVFLWDLFNPWGWWMELNSTHPLTGKRVRALSNYAEQLGLSIEFDLGRIINEGKALSKQKLYGGFFLDLLLYTAVPIGILVGLGMGAISNQATTMFAGAIMGYGIGTVITTLVMFPNFKTAAPTDVLELMSDPYASPLRGQAVQLQGRLIGRGDAGSKLGSDVMLETPTGHIYLHYASPFGMLGNLWFGARRVHHLIGTEVNAQGWFRRGILSWVDLTEFVTNDGTVVKSFHRLWSFIWGFSAIGLASMILVKLT